MTKPMPPSRGQAGDERGPRQGGRGGQAGGAPGEGALLPGEGRAPLAYDAMWAIALALNATLTALIAQGG